MEITSVHSLAKYYVDRYVKKYGSNEKMKCGDFIEWCKNECLSDGAYNEFISKIDSAHLHPSDIAFNLFNLEYLNNFPNNDLCLVRTDRSHYQLIGSNCKYTGKVYWTHKNKEIIITEDIPRTITEEVGEWIDGTFSWYTGFPEKFQKK